ncbi:hypothetical protein ACSS6W_003323 [Trichoderma asperelloides]
MANRDMCPTTLIEVKPGDETGIYHIIFCNLPFKATWQELKDWLSESCAIDYVEIFPVSCSGWVCIHGKENFETVLVRDEAIYATTTPEMMAFTDFMAVLLCMAALYKSPPAVYYPPALTFPGNEWDNYHGMSPCTPCPLFNDKIPTPPDSPEIVLPENAATGGDEDDKDDQYYLDEIQGNARERRAQSVPPSFRWAGNETSE